MAFTSRQPLEGWWDHFDAFNESYIVFLCSCGIVWLLYVVCHKLLLSVAPLYRSLNKERQVYVHSNVAKATWLGIMVVVLWPLLVSTSGSGPVCVRQCAC